MSISKLRWAILFLSFFILMFGSIIGLYFGYVLPTFSCCFVPSRAGTCFMLTLQQTIGTFTLDSMVMFFERFLIFSALIIILGRAWCGWICPLGLFQDAMDYLRGKLKIGYISFSKAVKKATAPVKWVFLGISLIVPIWVAFPLFCPGAALGLQIPFCQICPGKYILPLMTGTTGRVNISYKNGVYLLMSILGLSISILVIIGSMVKRRFWCSFCPLGLIMSWYRKISFLKLKKDDSKCTKCEICYNVCPLEIEDVYKSTGREDVTFPDCILCMKCVENCPEEGALSATYLGKYVYRSSSERFFNEKCKNKKKVSAGGKNE